MTAAPRETIIRVHAQSSRCIALYWLGSSLPQVGKEFSQLLARNPSIHHESRKTLINLNTLKSFELNEPIRVIFTCFETQR